MTPQTPRSTRFPVAAAAATLLVCLLAAGFLTVSAENGKDKDAELKADDSALQKGMTEGLNLKYEPSPAKTSEPAPAKDPLKVSWNEDDKDACVPFGSHTESVPHKDPLNSGCIIHTPVDPGTPDWYVSDPNNPYASADEEWNAYSELVKRAKAGHIPDGVDPQVERNRGVYTRYLYREGGARTPDDLNVDRDHQPWGDFVTVTFFDSPSRGANLTLVTARAWFDSNNPAKLHVEKWTFEPNNRGRLAWIKETDGARVYVAPDSPDSTTTRQAKYFWFYHQLLHSWIGDPPTKPAEP